jgi:DNA-binding response OmpR family regulator
VKRADKDVLIVEDDEAIAAGLALNLQIEGYSPTHVSDGESAVLRVAEFEEQQASGNVADLER